MNNIVVTGGSGFIGANFIAEVIDKTNHRVINLDKLTYAGSNLNLKQFENNDRYRFAKGDICDANLVNKIFMGEKPTALINFAAESHVDRSIDSPDDFIKTNINGVFNLLEISRRYHAELGEREKENFRFLHVSTDEVYGSLEPSEHPFTEENRYKPNSPYSASKASADHLVRAYFHTYNLPTLTTNCSNNYGPYQFPEKLIPLIILNAINGKKLPVYGEGLNIRDWLFVQDHCSAILRVLEKGKTGETYNIGGNCEKTNIDVVKIICSLLDELSPNSNIGSYESQIEFVKDRPSHDLRYAIDSTKIKNELGCQPKWTFEDGLRNTVSWYLENLEWCDARCKNIYQQERLGLKGEG